MTGDHVAIYVRLACTTQGEADPALNRQLEQVRSYARRHGWTVIGEFVDVGSSGRSTTRRALQQMLDGALSEPPKFTRILIECPDRLFRDGLLFEQHAATLNERGVEIVVTDPLARPMGRSELAGILDVWAAADDR